MVFSSPVFLFYFLPAVLLIYALVRGNTNLQNIVLFFSSLLFYFWGEKQYAILVLFSILINYSFGFLISKFETLHLKKWILVTGILANLSILIYYKYFNFIVSVIFNTSIEHTYIIDIYRKDAVAARSPLNVGLYILFFPQLIAGPIVRYKDIDKQLNFRTITNEKLYEGVRRFILGFAKKILIANTMGGVADSIYHLPTSDVSGAIVWLSCICYALQIYFDFSGYSDMAIGLAKIFGFEFVENFNFPYSAQSIQEFWRKWHMSLSTFFRDYVYIPLGGNRKGPFRMILNLIIVFFLTGLWHGASWNYIIWGLFHGYFLLVERAGLSTILEKFPKIFRHLYTLFVVTIGWVLFRIEDMNQAAGVFRKLFFLDRVSSGIYSVGYFIRPDILFILICGLIFSFPIHQYLKNFIPLHAAKPITKLMIDGCYLLLFLICLSVLSASTYNPFIYFRF
jgi:alginate O-acetyltransferase complex protein AlgI